MTQATTAGAWLNSISAMLTTLGLDAQALFVEAGIDLEAARDPHHRFESDQLSRLWNVITERSGNPAIALAGSDCPRPGSLDLLTYTMMTAPDMLGALQRFVRYIRIISDATCFTMEAEPRGHWLRLRMEGGLLPIPRQRYEFILITILNICRWISGKPLSPVQVNFLHEAPADLAPYTQAFNGALQFGAADHGILFCAADLEAPLPASNARMAELHERFAGEFLQQMDSSKITPKVRDIIVRSLPDGDPQRSIAAEALCISERTLQRRLQEEGTSFQQLLDDTRQELARQYLAQEQIALGQVAFMLGFADQSTFSRACQRWFTLTPRQVRKQLTGEHADA
ncbi:AraC family transcriptional regulator [Oxalobacteraceae bacterium]|nr:AraC family transcriptional regulator [Oxalobacteraceae bacterium]